MKYILVMFSYVKEKEGLHLATPKDEELIELALMYLNEAPYDFLPFSHTSSYMNLRDRVRRGSFVKKIVDGSTIIGFVVATIGQPPHLDTKCVIQEYYYCNAVGFKAAKVLIFTHKALIKWAEDNRIKIVISACNQLYKDSNLVDILAKVGWSVMGYTAVWRTSHHESPSS